MWAEHENTPFFSQFLCVSSVTEFSKEQNKLILNLNLLLLFTIF